MVSQETINEAIRRLTKVYNPRKIYLYGDYAENTINDESSFDLLVVVDTAEDKVLKRSYAGFEALLGLRIPANISVFTKIEFDAFAQDPKSTTAKIISNGKVLYARA